MQSAASGCSVCFLALQGTWASSPDVYTTPTRIFLPAITTESHGSNAALLQMTVSQSW